MHSRVGARNRNAIKAEKFRRSFLAYIGEFWPVIDPGHEYIQTPLIEAIAEHLQAVTEGRIMRLAISLPPGHGKSLLTSVLWPSWEWTHSPHIQSLYFSYDPELATFDGGRCRMLIESEQWQNTFNPEWSFRPDQNQKTYYINSRMGSRYSFGYFSTKKAGRRADKMVIDDFLSIDDRYDIEKKNKAVNIFDNVLQSRVHNPEKMKWVIVGHRLADNDLIGHVIKDRPEKWEYLKLPAEFNSKKRCSTSIGWTDWRKDDGELLFPKLYNADRMKIIKETSTPDDYAALYDQEPVKEGGSKFKREWFGRWRFTDETCRFISLTNPFTQESETLPFGRLSFFVSVDSAVEIKKDNDYTVYLIYGKLPDGRLIIMDRRKARMTEPESIRTAKDIQNHFRPNGKSLSYFAVEENGVGKPLIQNMEEAGIPVVRIHVHIDKMAMSTSARVLYSNGKIHHPERASWLLDFEQNLADFPLGDHDDDVSSVSIGAESLKGLGVGNVKASESIVDAKKPVREHLESHNETRTAQGRGVAETPRRFIR